MRHRKEIEDALARVTVIRELSQKQTWQFLQKWRELYCGNLHRQTGSWTGRGSHSWSTFNDSYFPSRHGEGALTEYKTQSGEGLLVLVEDQHSSGFEVVSKRPPTFENTFLDVYVTPHSMPWTMVFTHEHPEIGPFFALLDDAE
ncbi:MAG: hypothetical protein AAF219_11125 [Myxococcota bacterium]